MVPHWPVIPAINALTASLEGNRTISPNFLFPLAGHERELRSLKKKTAQPYQIQILEPVSSAVLL